MRDKILDGNLTLPSYEKFQSQIGNHYAKLANKLMRALWFQWMKDKGSVNLTYWSAQFDNPKVFNIVLISLSKAGWIISHSIPARNWAEAHLNENKLLEFCTADELESVRAHNKFKQYVLTNEPSTLSAATKLNGKVQDTGLVRTGFMKAGNTRFKFDKTKMFEFSDPIIKNLTKSMDKIAEHYPNMRHDRASYDTISTEIFEYMLISEEEYTRGTNLNDSRGRAISSVLSKVANPISSKDFRSMLVIPE